MIALYRDKNKIVSRIRSSNQEVAQRQMRKQPNALKCSSSNPRWHKR